MNKMLHIYLLAVIFFVDANDSTMIEKIINENNYYMCDKEDLNNLINKNYELLKFTDYPSFFIEYEKGKSILEISEGQLLFQIANCKIENVNGDIIITGYYIDENNNITSNLFYIIMRTNYSVYYSSYNNKYKFLFRVLKNTNLSKIIKEHYKEYWYQKYKNFHSIGFNWNGKEFIFNNKKYEYFIYPVNCIINKELQLNSKYLGIYLLNSINKNILLIEITENKELIINHDKNIILMKEGDFCIEE